MVSRSREAANCSREEALERTSARVAEQLHSSRLLAPGRYQV
ncbi:hypothetical protein [Streptomyces sp. NPDC059452]